MDALLNHPLFQCHGFWLGSLLWALAVGWFCWQIMAIVTYPRERLGTTHPFELQRRADLRAGNPIYRWFEPLVEELAALIARQKKESLDKVKLNLAAGREKL